MTLSTESIQPKLLLIKEQERSASAQIEKCNLAVTFSEIYLYTYTFVSVCCSQVVTIAMAINHPKADGLAAGACQESANSGTKSIEKEYCLGNPRDMNLYVLDCHTVRFADSS